MKPASVPKLPEGTPWERLDHAFRKTLTVSKEVLLKEEAKAKRKSANKRAKRK
jgi:hypothetical protein